MTKQPSNDPLCGRRVCDSMSDHASADSSMAVAQLIEAAQFARDGDREAAKARIARAMAILHGQPLSRSVATQTFRAVMRQTPYAGLAAWQARKIAAHVDANLCDQIHVADLAALLGLSSSYFSRKFTHTFGISPHAWLTRRRIEVAQGLMLTTDAPLSEIAQSCGMADQSHLSRSFRRIVGETPFSWRQSRRDVMGEQVAGRRGRTPLTSPAHNPSSIPPGPEGASRPATA